MEVISLQSGSNGNCFFVRAGETHLLIDAGISGNQAQQRLKQHGIDIRKVRGLLISHDHRDHIQGAGVFQRKYGMPLYVTQPTLTAAQRWCRLGNLRDVKHFCAGDCWRIGEIQIQTIPTTHDGADGVVFILEHRSTRVGVMTDLGSLFPALGPAVETLDAVVIESNYDDEMLTNGGYPEALKRRIRGDGGHISNHEAAMVLATHCQRLQWACLAHLSEHNNTPQIAKSTVVGAISQRFPVHVASRYEVSPKLSVNGVEELAQAPARTFSPQLLFD